eukprot:g2130.t1
MAAIYEEKLGETILDPTSQEDVVTTTSQEDVVQPGDNLDYFTVLDQTSQEDVVQPGDNLDNITVLDPTSQEDVVQPGDNLEHFIVLDPTSQEDVAQLTENIGDLTLTPQEDVGELREDQVRADIADGDIQQRVTPTQYLRKAEREIGKEDLRNQIKATVRNGNIAFTQIVGQLYSQTFRPNSLICTRDADGNYELSKTCDIAHYFSWKECVSFFQSCFESDIKETTSDDIEYLRDCRDEARTNGNQTSVERLDRLIFDRQTINYLRNSTCFTAFRNYVLDNPLNMTCASHTENVSDHTRVDGAVFKALKPIIKALKDSNININDPRVLETMENKINLNQQIRARVCENLQPEARMREPGSMQRVRDTIERLEMIRNNLPQQNAEPTAAEDVLTERDILDMVICGYHLVDDLLQTS